MNYSPKNYSLKISLLEDTLGSNENIEQIDISIQVDSDDAQYEIENATKKIRKDIDSNTSDIQRNIDEAISIIISDLKDDLDQAIENYLFLTKNKLIDEGEIFPFQEWFDTLNGTRQNFLFPEQSVNHFFNELQKSDADLWLDNFKDIILKLNQDQYRHMKNPGCKILKQLMEKSLGKDEDLWLNILSAHNYEEIEKAFKKKNILPNEKNNLLFTDLISQLNREEVEKFSQSNAWNKIKDSTKAQVGFIKALIDNYNNDSKIVKRKRMNKYPYSMIDGVNWDKALELVQYCFKENIEVVEIFANTLINVYHGSEKDKNLMESNKLISAAKYFKLEKDLPHKDEVNSKKSKI